MKKEIKVGGENYGHWSYNTSEYTSLCCVNIQNTERFFPKYIGEAGKVSCIENYIVFGTSSGIDTN